jgi:hypothetical protein
MAAIDFPDKTTGDQFTAENCNEIKSAVNELYMISVTVAYNGFTEPIFQLINRSTGEIITITAETVSPLLIPKGFYDLTYTTLPEINDFNILGVVSFYRDNSNNLRAINDSLTSTDYDPGERVCIINSDFKLTVSD